MDFFVALIIEVSLLFQRQQRACSPFSLPTQTRAYIGAGLILLSFGKSFGLKTLHSQWAGVVEV